MRAEHGRIWFSPSDLSDHLACGHLTTLALAALHGAPGRPHPQSDYGDLIRRKGAEHERSHLDRLRAAGREVEQAHAGAGDLAAGAARTADLMRAGVEIVYQAPFVVDGWRGIADFLERVGGETELGPYGYEAVDTKLARAEALPHHVLQLCFYSLGVARAQGAAPRHAHLELGSGERETIRVRDVAAYHRFACRGFELAARSGRGATTAPYPCEHCAICDFREACRLRLDAEDSLSRVAAIRRDQVERLCAGGISTLAALASAPAGLRMTDLRPAVLDSLRAQAALQLAARRTGRAEVELRPLEADRGFARLPRPSPGDVVLDLEGDPFFTPARELTFLFGFLLRDGDGWRYKPFWAHDDAGERRALEQAVDLVMDRLERVPDLHVFHYSHAEPSAIARLAGVHATREAELDELLRRKVLVDLYGVVRQGLRAGVAGYGLKQVERLAGFERTGNLASGAEAVLGYERWRETRDDAELAAIAAYNAEDCRRRRRSTRGCSGCAPRRRRGSRPSAPSSASPTSSQPTRRARSCAAS